MKKTLRLLMPLWALILLAGCSTSPTFLRPASSVSSEESTLYGIVIVLSAVVFLIVEGLLVYVLIRYRRRPGAEGVPEQTYRNLMLEVIWTAIPLVLVVVLFVFTVRTVMALAVPNAEPNDVKVHTIGHRWWWEFDYPDLGIQTANELHVPVNTTIQIDLTSVDVVHSFWVPQLAGKTDVVPGHPNRMWFKATKTGTYYGHCAEFCGQNHANMRIKVIVQSQEEFDTWVANQQQPPTEPQTDLQQQGYEIITTGVCHNCHTLGDHKAIQPIGPNLTHLYSRSVFAGATFKLNEENLRHWIQNSGEMKPGNDMSSVSPSPDEVDALIAYLKTLK